MAPSSSPQGTRNSTGKISTESRRSTPQPQIGPNKTRRTPRTHQGLVTLLARQDPSVCPTSPPAVDPDGRGNLEHGGAVNAAAAGTPNRLLRHFRIYFQLVCLHLLCRWNRSKQHRRGIALRRRITETFKWIWSPVVIFFVGLLQNNTALGLLRCWP